MEGVSLVLNTTAYSRSSSPFSGSHLCYPFHHLLYSCKQACQRCVHSWFSALLYFLLYTRQEQVISSFKLSTWANSRWSFSFFLSQEGWHCSLLCLGSHLCLSGKLQSNRYLWSSLLHTHTLSFSRWDPHIGLPGRHCPGWILLSWCPQTMALSCALRSWGRKYSKSTCLGLLIGFPYPEIFIFVLCTLVIIMIKADICRILMLSLAGRQGESEHQWLSSHFWKSIIISDFTF